MDAVELGVEKSWAVTCRRERDPMEFCFANHECVKTTKSRLPTVTIVYLGHKKFLKFATSYRHGCPSGRLPNSAVLSVQSKVCISLFINPTVGYLEFACETAIK